MTEMEKRINRRNFLKAAGTAGLSSVLVTAKAAVSDESDAADSNRIEGAQKPAYPQVPRRKLGRTGVEVPCLSLGTNRLDSQVVLRAAVRHGISYWDTSPNYVGQNSELNIGRFLSKSPELRKKLFIVTKASGARSGPNAKAFVAAVEERLRASLERMNAEYVDLYYGVHGLSDPAQLTDELKEWVKSAKERKLIRFFGFSTHKNMAQNLAAAAKLDWIDAIMTAYNFRLMQDPDMRAAVKASHEAGIGVVAMKVIALSVKERSRLEAGQKIETEQDKKLLGHFLEQGLTVEQAKIKYVLADKRISSACIGMSNVANLASNVAAALDKNALTQADMEALNEYARATCSGYCAGCAHLCDSVLPDAPYLSDIMRYLMYYNGYGEHDEARKRFAEIPGSVRGKLLDLDYRVAEARCPQHLPIRELIAEALEKLT